MTSIAVSQRLSSKRELQTSIAQAVQRLHQKLARLDVERLSISQYNKNYLRRKLVNPIGSLQLYGHLLGLSLSGADLPLADVTLVDYGGGTGLLSLLARELGVGCVLYNDIYSVSCKDIKVVADTLGLGLDHYVCGDIEELIAYASKQNCRVDAIVSYDVLEHIYDVEGYFKHLRKLSPNSLRVVFGSSANNANPFIRRRFQQIQVRREYCNRTKKPGHSERDGQRAFLAVREEIIRKCDPAMSEEVLTRLAKATRGLRQVDIEAVVKEFLRTGVLVYTPIHPTNTCDPNTGNWAEHLMPAEWLVDLLRRLGFHAQILGGPWRYDRRLWKRLVKNVLNGALAVFGIRALCIAPYYIVYADFFAAQKPTRDQSGAGLPVAISAAR